MVNGVDKIGKMNWDKLLGHSAMPISHLLFLSILLDSNKSWIWLLNGVNSQGRRRVAMYPKGFKCYFSYKYTKPRKYS